MRPLEGQLAVVTGASRGVGQAIALALAAGGANLCLVGRDPGSLESVARAATGDAHRCYRADLAAEADVEALAGALERDFPRVDVLVHAAGVLHWGPLETGTPAQLDNHYRTNLRAPWVLTQRLLARLRSVQGQVVFVNSSAGLAARANAVQYAATKHALKALADGLREEVNADGIRVLSLFLGRTATRMQAELHALEGKAFDPAALVQPQDVAALVLQALSLPRSVEVTDISLRPMRKPPA
jgi:NAD(P)-dependent dehydrogenase (short-subunit alcohol dehydrogenase family)